MDSQVYPRIGEVEVDIFKVIGTRQLKLESLYPYLATGAISIEIPALII